MSNPLITVTGEHIAESKANDSSHCMIADAIKDAIPDARNVSVDLQTIRFSRNRTAKRYVYFTPPVAQRALLRFDDGDETLDAFEFVLPAPAQTHQAKRHSKRTDHQPKLKARNSSRKAPTVEGGKTLPVAQLAGGAIPGKVTVGRRRRFGLRAMARPASQVGVSAKDVG